MNPPLALRDILARIGTELTDLGLRADDLQELIGILVERSSLPIGPDARIRLQGIDSIAQRLARLAALLTLLEGVTPNGAPVGNEGVERDELTAALSRLSGAGGAQSEQAAAVVGECELF